MAREEQKKEEKKEQHEEGSNEFSFDSIKRALMYEHGRASSLYLRVAASENEKIPGDDTLDWIRMAFGSGRSRYSDLLRPFAVPTVPTERRETIKPGQAECSA